MNGFKSNHVRSCFEKELEEALMAGTDPPTNRLAAQKDMASNMVSHIFPFIYDSPAQYAQRKNALLKKLARTVDPIEQYSLLSPMSG